MPRSARRSLRCLRAAERHRDPPGPPSGAGSAVLGAIAVYAAVAVATLLAPVVLLAGLAASPLVLAAVVARARREAARERPPLARARARWGSAAAFPQAGPLQPPAARCSHRSRLLSV